jgi:hypothetical protein
VNRKVADEPAVNRKVAIIILNWDSWRDTIECLESLFLIDYQNYVPIIVDNGSSDGSIDRLREFARGSLQIESKFFGQGRASNPIEMVEYTRDQVDRKNIEGLGEDSFSNQNLVLIKNQRNYGFAEGNNIGIQFALDSIKPDYVLLLNSDTVVDPGFLRELVRIGESDDTIGAVGPKIYYYDNPSKINSAGCEMHDWYGGAINIGIGETDNHNRFNEIREVDCLHGSAILIKAPTLEDVGLLDQDFFVLLEETEWCLRAKKAGYKIVFAPTAWIYHKEGFSGTEECVHYYYSNRNRILLLKKHQTSLRKPIYGLSITLRTLAGSIILSVTGKPSLAICGLKGYFNGLRV